MSTSKKSDIVSSGVRQGRAIAFEVAGKGTEPGYTPSREKSVHLQKPIIQRKPGEDEELLMQRMPIGNQSSINLQAFQPLQKNNRDTDHTKLPFIQTKLSINTTGDPFEQEADAMADKVMRMKDSFSPTAHGNNSIDPVAIQRTCQHCEDEEKHVRRKEKSASEMQESSNLDNYIGSLNSSGHAIPESSRQFFEPRFGQDFSNVRIHTDPVAAKSAKAINALAYTTGNHIVFNQGQYAPGSESGQRLMAHELTHVVQQGSKNDKKNIQRFQVEGCFDYHQPVHETLIKESLKKSGINDNGTKDAEFKAYEFIRGVYWNDDPLGMMFDKNDKDNSDFSSCYEWVKTYHAAGNSAKELSKSGKMLGKSDNLLGRSHYGDLQFLHGMASTDNEAPSVTKGNMMLWAEFTYKVAIEQIPGDTLMANVPVAGIPELFPQQATQTVSHFFGIDKKGDVTRRAIGSLLHMIQDSYASGHTQREDRGYNQKGDIIEFHNYASQNEDKHGKDDAWQGGGNNAEKIDKLPGGSDAVLKGYIMLNSFKQKESWETVKIYLNNIVFEVAETPHNAGPGDKYKK
jgi:hypothetical protein